LVTVFGTVIQAFVRPVFCARIHLLDGWDVAGQLIREDHARPGRLPIKEALQERFRCRLVASLLEEDVEDHAVRIDRTPEIPGAPADAQLHFIQVPPVTGSGSAPLDLRREAWPELEAPPADRLVRDHDPASGEHLLHLSIAHGKPRV
jgi:hypothetical protein